MSYKEKNLPSDARHWPKNLKFMGVSLFNSEVRKVHQRTTYDLLNAFGDVGGIFEFLHILASLLVGGFAAVKERALMAKHLYRFFNEK